MRLRHYVIIAAVALILSFGVYLFPLYQQLDRAFSNQEQLVPTRIYSDVYRLAPSHPRTMVEERLHVLGYTPNRGPDGEDRLGFQLHAMEYPVFLIPDNHPQIDAANSSGGAQVVLSFDGSGPDSLLHSIQLNGQEVPDLYLEPELVALLSRGGAAKAGDPTRREIRTYAKFDDIPTEMKQAITAVEDQHFMEHKGFDPRGFARALWFDLRHLTLQQGGSTLTQQLVKNLVLTRRRSFSRKVPELFLALMLELKFSKEQILERYLNEVSLGQVGNIEIHGVSEGAEHFFGKKLNELSLGEIALMAGQIRGTEFYSPYKHLDRAIERQHVVLRKMVETGQIADAEMDAALSTPIHLAPPQTQINKAPYFVDFVKAELFRQLKDHMTEDEVSQAGFRVYTTLDSEMNTAAQGSVATGIAGLEKMMKLAPGDKLEGALASVDQSTGFIRALIGGRSYSESTFNRILNMKRQVGSTFKPVVYLSAILKGEDPQGVPYGPGHPAEDAPWKLVFDHDRQSWSPRNYEKEFLGWINFRTALAHSINTVASRLGVEVGLDNVIKTARQLGIESELPVVPSLSLGIPELSPVELLRAYAVIANHGTQDELTVVRAITHNDGTTYARFVYHPLQVIDAASTDLLIDMLQSVFTDGTAHEAPRLGFDRPAAGKTGTTSHHRDAWFAGFTPQLTTVVWVGEDQPKSEAEEAKKKKKVVLTGAGSALPIWASFMHRALLPEPPASFPVSPNLVDAQIDRRSGKLSSSGCPSNQIAIEKYLKGHEPHSQSCESAWPPSVSKVTLQ